MLYFIIGIAVGVTGLAFVQLLFYAASLGSMAEQERAIKDETTRWERMQRDMGEGEMDCPACGNEMSLHDTTYSNVSTKRAEIGQHTGDIYYCERCKEFWLDDFLSGEIYQWRG